MDYNKGGGKVSEKKRFFCGRQKKFWLLKVKKKILNSLHFVF